MARQSNFAAEYARRIARGLGLGRTRAQSRGHPTKAIAPPQATTREKVGHVVQRIAGGERRADALKAEHLAGETFKRHEDEYGYIRYDRKEKRTTVHAAGAVSFGTTDGVWHDRVPFGPRELKNTMSPYLNAAQHWARTGDATRFEAFAGVKVYDVFGNEYELIGNIDAHVSLAGVTDEDDYFYSGEIEVTLPPTSVAA